MAASGIALLGSCVTRDVWRLLDLQPGSPAFFLSRTSLASVSRPMNGSSALDALAARVPGTDTFARRVVTTEIRKSAFAELAALRPDVLMLDFIDERFDLLACGDVLVNESLEMLESGLLAQAPLAQARRIPRLSEEAWARWLAGLLRLRRFLDGGQLPSCRLVLHACYWADTMRTSSGNEPLPDRCEILHGRVVSRAAHNELLCRMHAAFAARFPEATLIEPPPALRIVDGAHRWGPAPFHFIPEYYRAFARAAVEQGLMPRPANGAEATCSAS
ncbi:DUF6270 domain-containing protein [Xanthobacter sp. V2C-8]|uniref:DUF6270 domain-containing protein n=1 Tax=Xanthobacter albus TaxID=3119929 RepID=UPI003729B05E